MRLPISQFVFAVFACTTAPCSAQSLACPAALAWSDYTYVQRTTTEGGLIAEAELRKYANAHVLHVSLDGKPVSMIRMTSAGAEGVVLMKGPGDEGPATLGEVAMILEFPMAEGALRGLAAPCDLADGETRLFDGADLLTRSSAVVDKGVVNGSMTRHDLRISYTVMWNDPLGPGHTAQRWVGVWETAHRLETFPLSTDVRSWRVYRNNVLVRVPASTALTLGALLAQTVPAPAGR